MMAIYADSIMKTSGIMPPLVNCNSNLECGCLHTKLTPNFVHEQENQ